MEPSASTWEYPRPVADPQRNSDHGSFVPGPRLEGRGGAKLTSETRWLLQQRIHAVSRVLFVGFGLFFARALALHSLESMTVIFHGVMLVLPLLALAATSRRGKPTLRQLRWLEVVLFALIVVCFMGAQYALMLKGLREENSVRLQTAVKSSVLWMLSMIFTYAIFVPNHWRRAASVIVPMALAPMLVPQVLAQVHPELYQIAIRATTFDQFSEHALFLILGAFTAVYGTHTINTLRTEAYEARLLNQYRLGRKLGGGGMGEVYLAEHQMLKRPCAIKLIRPDLAGIHRVFARFEREVRATAQLSHWNTIEIFDYGRNDDGAFYYVMEYLPGLSFAEIVHQYGPMPAARAIYLLRQACDALREAHDSGLIHRDIKPANLMAAYRGGQHDVTKLLDFGLVKTLAEDDSVHLSKENTVAGSPLYMAPEQIMKDRAPDRRTDIYGLGAVAYFALTGRPPFLGNNAMSVMIAHARDPVIPPRRLNPEVPEDLERVVLRCLAKNPIDRYPDTTSLAEALDQCAAARDWSPTHALDWWQSYRHAHDSRSGEARSSVQGDDPVTAVTAERRVD
jgi:serine/threonine-protein kinase